MKNLQKGFVVPLLTAVIAVLVVGGGLYFYKTKNMETLSPIDLQMDQSNQTDISSWKKYSDASISFEYPALISVKQDAGNITLSHSVDYKHPNPCDFKGDAPPLDQLSDFGVSLKIINQNLKEFVQSSAYPGWDYVSKNPFTFGSLNGYKVYVGVEGCGYDIYYLTISSAKTLIIQRNHVAEFNSINANYQTYLNLPGIISPNKGTEYFNHILSTINFVSSPSTVTSTLPPITVLSPNGGENIPYGTIYMAGDLGFTWRTSSGENYTPTSKLYAALIDENNMVVRSDQINSKTNTGNGVYASSFIGESKVQVNKKYKIRVCDEIELGKFTCDESNDYFIITN
ncbi:MAG: hypothetical protein KBD43_14870 [Saprospiraceae bacterium]|nr:hypothetical protein [Saprospiraceae bacterium]